MDAEAEAKKGYSIAKRSSIAPAVVQDIKVTFSLSKTFNGSNAQ